MQRGSRFRQGVLLSIVMCTPLLSLSTCAQVLHAAGGIGKISAARHSLQPPVPVGKLPSGFLLMASARNADSFAVTCDRGVYDVTLKGDQGQLPGAFQDRLIILNTYTFFEITDPESKYCIATHYYYLDRGTRSRPVFSGEVRNWSPLYAGDFIGYGAGHANEGLGRQIFGISEVLRNYDSDVDAKIRSGNATDDRRTITLRIEKDNTTVWVYTRYAEGWHKVRAHADKIQVDASAGSRADNNRGIVLADGAPVTRSVRYGEGRVSFVIEDSSREPGTWRDGLLHGGIEMVRPTTKFSLRFEIVWRQ